jgi:hypothetical protein
MIFSTFLDKLTDELKGLTKTADFIEKCNFVQVHVDNHSNNRDRDGQKKSEQTTTSTTDVNTPTKVPTGPTNSNRNLCTGCGRQHPGDSTICFFKDTHPNFNYSESSWSESQVGKMFKSTYNWDILPGKLCKLKDNDKYQPWSKDGPKPTATSSNKGNTTPSKKSIEYHHFCSINSATQTKPIRSATIIQNHERLTVQALLDTGAEHGSYASSKLGIVIDSKTRIWFLIWRL